MRDGVKEGVAEMRAGGLLCEDVCRVPRRESRKELVLGVCEDEKREAVGPYSSVEKGCVEVEIQICGGHGVLE